MPLRRLSIYFVQNGEGPKKVPTRLAKPGDAVPLGSTKFVALRVGRDGAIEVEDLRAESAAGALREVEPSTRIGIPIARSRALGIVFQVAIAAGVEKVDNPS